MMPPAHRSVIALVAFAAALSGCSQRIVGGGGDTMASPPTRYRITDLGTLGGELGYASDLNTKGDAVGRLDVGGQGHPFARLGGKTFRIGARGRMTIASGINNHGQVVGATATGRDTYRAFLWQGGRLRDLGTLGGATSYAQDINDAGQIVGFSQGRSGKGHAFLWEKGRMRDLGLGHSSYGDAISKHGQVTGRMQGSNRNRTTHAFLWDKGRITDLGEGDARALNDKGQVVGQSHGQAVLWQGGRRIELETLSKKGHSFAWGINERGQIVGMSHPAGGRFMHAVLWQGREIYDLNDRIPAGSGWELHLATAINERGQILGSGRLAGQSRAFVLTPAEEAEPSRNLTRLEMAVSYNN